MKVWIVSNGVLHLFDNPEYATIYSLKNGSSIVWGPYDVNSNDDMKTVNAEFPWKIYRYYKDPNSIQKGPYYLYVYAKSDDHADKLLIEHNPWCAEYWPDEIVNEIPIDTVIGDIINFAKEQ